jgi:hypothetical protein
MAADLPVLFAGNRLRGTGLANGQETVIRVLAKPAGSR